MRRALRFLLRGSLGALMVLALMLVVLYGALRGGLVTSRLDAIITALAQKEGVFFVTAEGVSGSVPGHVKVKKVEVGDHYGVWLTVEDGEATWSPFDLFHPFDFVKWRVNVDDVVARKVTWTRLPKDGPDEVDEPFHWDRFIRILVGHIRVDDFELTGSILGGATAHVKAEGHGVLGEWDQGRVVLDLERIDGVPGKARIDLSTTHTPAADGGTQVELFGSVTAEEGEGSALASLARLDDAGAVKLEARGSGPMRNWSGAADVTAGNIGVLKATTELAFTAEGPFQLEGTFDPAPRQREKYLVGEGAPMKLFAKGNWAPDVELRIDRARLDADGRELTAKARLDLDTLAFELAGSLEHADETALVHTTLLDVASGRIEGRGVLSDGGHLDAKLDLREPQRGELYGTELQAQLHAKDARGESVPTYELEAEVTGLRLGDIVLPLFGNDARLAATGRVELTEDILAADRLALSGKEIRIEGPLAFQDEWQGLKTTLRAESPSLATLAPLVGMTVSGSATARLELDVKDDWEHVDLALHSEGASLALGEEGWNALVGSTAVVEASYRGSTEGPGDGHFDLKTAGLSAIGDVTVEAGGKNLVADAKLSLDNLSRLAEPARAAIAGRVEATAKARGTLEHFSLDAVLEGERFSWEGLRFDKLAADVKADGLPKVWAGDVSARGSYGKSNASLDAAVSMPSKDQLVIRELLLRGPRSEAKASLAVDLAALTASGNLSMHSEDLSLWRPMTGLTIGGAVHADLALDATRSSGGKAVQELSGSASIRDGVFPLGEGGKDELFIDELDARAEKIEIGPAPRGSANLKGARLRYDTTVVTTATANVRGDGRLWNFDASADVRDERAITLSASGTVLPGEKPEITFAEGSGTAAGIAVELAEPARLRAERSDFSAWTLPLFSLVVGDGGRLTGKASQNASSLHLEAEAKALPLAALSAASPALDLEGTLDGRMRLDGRTLATATGEVSLRGKKVASRGLEAQGVEPVDLEADGTLARGRVTGTAFVAGLTDTQLQLRIDAPFTPTAPGDNVVVDLLWKGEVAEAFALLPLGEDQLKGRIDADLRISGTVTAPRVTGRAVLDGARWEHASSGLVLDGIRAELVGSGTTLTLQSLTATDGESGRVTGQGVIRFQDFPGYDVNLSVEATDAMLARLDLVTAKADAKLNLTLSRPSGERSFQGAVTGEVRIEDGRIEIPQRFIADVPELDVIEVGAQLEEAVVLGGTEGRSKLDLDIAILADNRIFVTGRGLESEWSSKVQIRGDTSDPRVFGEVASVRGQLGLLGRRFDVSTGTIRFDGTKGNVPFLQLTARAEANDITAIAEVTGPALNPTIELRSEPALPRDEVLSRLLFGQSAANLTPIQSVQLARSVAELTGSPLGGGGGFLTGIGRSIGFDRLDIESSGPEGAAALTASKYLTDTVYLRVQQGLTPEASKLSLEWRIFRSLTIESDVSQDAQAEVGATWRWDY